VLAFFLEDEAALGAAFFADEEALADFAVLAFFAAGFVFDAAVFDLEEPEDFFGVTNFSMPEASIAVAAAPATAPLAAPEARSPITSVAFL